jgi:2-polyprenyl-3-methyl-5-hydroxy-6-metoxy-1,4-benzoquinol methylase
MAGAATSAPLKTPNVALTDDQKRHLRGAMLETYFLGWDAEHMASAAGESDILDIVHRRYDSCVRHIVPWIERHGPLAGKTVVEIGCGSGSSTSAMAHFAGLVDGYDILPASVEAARRRAEILGQTNIRLHALPPNEIMPSARREHVQGAEVVLLYAVLEHQTVPERLETLRDCWNLLREGGLLVVVETPNRLTYFDGHTSRLPFFSMLPDEVALRYASRSPRPEFIKSMDQARAAPNPHEALARWGRGVSYHEFELALGDLNGLVVGDGYDPEILSMRPILVEERCLYTYWVDAKIDAPVGFVRDDLYLIFQKGGTKRSLRDRVLPIRPLAEQASPPLGRRWWQR